MFVYTSKKQQFQKYFWGGMLLFSLPAMISRIILYISSSPFYSSVSNIIGLTCLAYGFYLVRKGNKMMREAAKESTVVPKRRDISKPVGLIFGIITLAFVPVSFLFAIAIIFGATMTENSQTDWSLTIAGVVLGVLSVFLAVVGWRLIKVRKGWTGDLFAPYTLWLRVPGWIFLLIGLIKLIQRNLSGLWVIVIGIVLIVLSGKKEKIAKTT